MKKAKIVNYYGDERIASLKRDTKETSIQVKLNVDGKGLYRIQTGIKFFDHMLSLLSAHSLCDITLKAEGDLDVDYHHTVEDVGLVIGNALNRALGERAGIHRYGYAYVPMDEALSRAVIDLGGRPYLVYKLATRRKKIKDFDITLVEDFLRALCIEGRMNLHAEQLYGEEPHHALESLFKAIARAMRQAVAIEHRIAGKVPSTKGVL
jgi:imidazoleglycerol-phosphate dehydratase